MADNLAANAAFSQAALQGDPGRRVVRDGRVAKIHPFYWDTAVLAPKPGKPDV